MSNKIILDACVPNLGSKRRVYKNIPKCPWKFDKVSRAPSLFHPMSYTKRNYVHVKAHAQTDFHKQFQKFTLEINIVGACPKS